MNDETYEAIVKISEEGNYFYDREVYDEAIKKYKNAFKLIPFPKNDYEASFWLLSSIGDCLYFKNEFEAALDFFRRSETMEGGLNPFVWLRIGQCYLELDELRKARDYLIRAYAVEGEDIFADEPQKYILAISDLI